MTLEELLREAQVLEETGGLWKADHVAAILGISRATVFRTPYFQGRRIRIGQAAARWQPADVRLYIALQMRA